MVAVKQSVCKAGKSGEKGRSKFDSGYIEGHSARSGPRGWGSSRELGKGMETQRTKIKLLPHIALPAVLKGVSTEVSKPFTSTQKGGEQRKERKEGKKDLTWPSPLSS